MIFRFIVLSVTVLACVCGDQSAKAFALTHLYGQSSVSYLGGIFHLVYAENSGTVFGIGSAWAEDFRFFLFVILVVIMLVTTVLYVLLKPLRPKLVFAIALVVGGGLSNLIDRVYHNGTVIDFMVIRVGMLESGIFNLADMAIVFGVVILCFLVLDSREKSD